MKFAISFLLRGFYSCKDQEVSCKYDQDLALPLFSGWVCKSGGFALIFFFFLMGEKKKIDVFDFISLENKTKCVKFVN